MSNSYQDYEGPIKCWVCGGLLDVKLDDGRIKRIRPMQLKEITE